MDNKLKAIAEIITTHNLTKEQAYEFIRLQFSSVWDDGFAIGFKDETNSADNPYLKSNIK